MTLLLLWLFARGVQERSGRPALVDAVGEGTPPAPPGASFASGCLGDPAGRPTEPWPAPYPANVQFEESVETRGHLLDSGVLARVLDDGPLPDVYTDVVEGQRAMRAELPGVGFVMMVATMLHSIATGNILPASVPLVCVDINPATVTKLADRGSSQAIGIVTDIGLFLEQLAHELVPGFSGSDR